MTANRDFSFRAQLAFDLLVNTITPPCPDRSIGTPQDLVFVGATQARSALRLPPRRLEQSPQPPSRFSRPRGWAVILGELACRFQLHRGLMWWVGAGDRGRRRRAPLQRLSANPHDSELAGLTGVGC